MPGQLLPHVANEANPMERERLISEACVDDLRAILSTPNLYMDTKKLAQAELYRRTEQRENDSFALAQQTARDTKLGIKLMAFTLGVSVLAAVFALIALFK